MIHEYWTVSRQSLVLSGPRDRLQELADRIDVARDEIIDMAPNRAVLALWGDALKAYQQHACGESQP